MSDGVDVRALRARLDADDWIRDVNDSVFEAFVFVFVFEEEVLVFEVEVEAVVDLEGSEGLDPEAEFEGLGLELDGLDELGLSDIMAVVYE